MAIGLIGAPATFHKSMNTTLAPLLRKCVFVFFDDILVSSPSWESHLQHLRQVLELLAADQWKIKMSNALLLGIPLLTLDISLVLTKARLRQSLHGLSLQSLRS
jgi:hypothetical protein